LPTGGKTQNNYSLERFSAFLLKIKQEPVVQKYFFFQKSSYISGWLCTVVTGRWSGNSPDTFRLWTEEQYATQLFIAYDFLRV